MQLYFHLINTTLILIMKIKHAFIHYNIYNYMMHDHTYILYIKHTYYACNLWWDFKTIWHTLCNIHLIKNTFTMHK